MLPVLVNVREMAVAGAGIFPDETPEIPAGNPPVTDQFKLVLAKEEVILKTAVSPEQMVCAAFGRLTTGASVMVTLVVVLNSKHGAAGVSVEVTV